MFFDTPKSTSHGPEVKVTGKPKCRPIYVSPVQSLPEL